MNVADVPVECIIAYLKGVVKRGGQNLSDSKSHSGRTHHMKTRIAIVIIGTPVFVVSVINVSYPVRFVKWITVIFCPFVKIYFMLQKQHLVLI